VMLLCVCVYKHEMKYEFDVLPFFYKQKKKVILRAGFGGFGGLGFGAC